MEGRQKRNDHFRGHADGVLMTGLRRGHVPVSSNPFWCTTRSPPVQSPAEFCGWAIVRRRGLRVRRGHATKCSRTPRTNTAPWPSPQATSRAGQTRVHLEERQSPQLGQQGIHCRGADAAPAAALGRFRGGRGGLLLRGGRVRGRCTAATSSRAVHMAPRGVHSMRVRARRNERGHLLSHSLFTEIATRFTRGWSRIPKRAEKLGLGQMFPQG